MYIDDVSMVVKPAGKFYHLDLYMTYHVTEPQKFSENDSLEIVHYFGLSKNTAITDSWLWVGGVIMQADILEKNKAYTIYEGIVNRRKDPSVLYKYNEKNYEFRIFPLNANLSRRVKLSFLVPSNEKDQIDLPLGMFNDSHPRPKVTLFQYEKDSQQTPVLSNGIEFENGEHPEYGAYKKAILEANDYDPGDGEHSGVNFHTEQAASHLYLSAAKESGQSNSGVFQLSVNPSGLMGLDTLHKNRFVFVLDYQLGNNLFSKTEILTALKTQIRSMVKEKDEFRILYSQLTPREISQDWLHYEDLEKLDSLMSGIELGNTSLIGALLYEAYTHVKDEKSGVLFVLSSDANVASPSEAQLLIEELTAQVGVLRQTFIVDFATFDVDTPSTSYNGKIYYGNEYLYKILCSNTRGKNATMIFDDKKDKIYDHMEELGNSLFDSRFDYIDFSIKPASGITYDVYPIKLGNRFLHVGRYIGELPFTLEVQAIYNDSIIFNTYLVSDDGLSKDVSIYRQCQALGEIIDLESILSSGDDHIISIVKASLENRVLSKYTAFLALEPGLQEPCLNCEDESNSTVGIEQTKLDPFLLTASPNPFENGVIITIKGEYNITDIEKVEIIDLTGKATILSLSWARSGDGLVAALDGSDLQSGMYLLRIMLKGKVYILKLVKV